MRMWGQREIGSGRSPPINVVEGVRVFAAAVARGVLT
jgi:hypothetical protein